VEQPIRSDEGARIVPLRTAAPPPPPIAELFVQAMRIAVGLAVLSAEALIGAVGRTLGAEPDATAELEAEEGPLPSGVPLLAGAALGVTLETVRWGVRALETVGRTAELMFGLAPRPAFVQQPVERATGVAEGLDARWREQRPRDEEAAAAFLQLLVPQVIDAVLDQVDLNELVRERIEVDRVVDRVDLERVVARIDLDEIAARIDVDRIVERLDMHALVQRLPIDEVADRIDVDRVVSRVDLDSVASRIDVEAIVRRLDLAAIALDVIEEIDLASIIRDAMGSMTTETVGGIRVQSMNADRAIARVVDRVLQRRGDRDERADTPDAHGDRGDGS
jgi:hypothetical protein